MFEVWLHLKSTQLFSPGADSDLKTKRLPLVWMAFRSIPSNFRLMQFQIKLHFIWRKRCTSLANSSTNSLQLCSCQKSRALQKFCTQTPDTPAWSTENTSVCARLYLYLYLYLYLCLCLRIRICTRLLCLRVCVSGGEVFVWVRKYLKCHIRSSEIKCECCFTLQKRAAEVSNLHSATKLGTICEWWTARTEGANLLVYFNS